MSAAQTLVDPINLHSLQQIGKRSGVPALAIAGVGTLGSMASRPINRISLRITFFGSPDSPVGSSQAFHCS